MKRKDLSPFCKHDGIDKLWELGGLFSTANAYLPVVQSLYPVVINVERGHPHCEFPNAVNYKIGIDS